MQGHQNLSHFYSTTFILLLLHLSMMNFLNFCFVYDCTIILVPSLSTLNCFGTSVENQLTAYV